MQVRWNYKLQPNKGQLALMSEWLVTLRKHRNYCLAERRRSFESNNQHSDQPVMYSYGAFCDIQSHVEYGAFCPLTCPVVKHGVMSSQTLTKQDGKWLSVSGVQSARTTELRNENSFYSRIYSGVLQGNLAKLDAAYLGFFQHKRGFPAFRRASNFNSFQYKPGAAKLTVNRTSKKKRCYSHVYLPGLGDMRYLDSRTIPPDADIRTITVMKEADGWYMSVLLNLPESLPEVTLIETVTSAVGIDMGINKLIALSDGSFIENPRFATNKKTRRQLRIRQRRVNRKVKGSKNRRKAGIEVAKLHKKIADKRNDYQWKAANKVVNTAEAVIREDLNIAAMKSRCKPRKILGRFMPNGQSAKRGLNRSISDASWGDTFSKIDWLAAKSGKPVLAINPRHTSQECSACGHTSKLNRDGEKFLCEDCGHIDHADTQASRTILRRANLKFVSTRRKNLSGDSRKVTLVRDDSAILGIRDQGKNRTSKVIPEKRILFEQLCLQLFD
ncbi:MAG: transposase [Nostoc sp.]|uniref:RNA-guided endonuclease InsQ/TnpB family protein n=1 Tax=Nostoc sp. TaxID=1180 RepID=UPI002FFCC128